MWRSIPPIGSSRPSASSAPRHLVPGRERRRFGRSVDVQQPGAAGGTSPTRLTSPRLDLAAESNWAQPRRPPALARDRVEQRRRDGRGRHAAATSAPERRRERGDAPAIGNARAVLSAPRSRTSRRRTPVCQVGGVARAGLHVIGAADTRRITARCGIGTVLRPPVTAGRVHHVRGSSASARASGAPAAIVRDTRGVAVKAEHEVIRPAAVRAEPARS